MVAPFNYSSGCCERLRGDVGVRRLETAANTRLRSKVLTHILLFIHWDVDKKGGGNFKRGKIYVFYNIFFSIMGKWKSFLIISIQG